MTDRQEILSRILKSGPLLQLAFYQVNENFFELPDDEFWIIDGGIELKFSGGVVSAAWDSSLDSYIIKNDSVKNIYNQDNIFQLETENIKNLTTFVGQKVIDVHFKSLEFEFIVDYTMRVEKEKRWVQLVIEFENKQHIQIAFIDYILEENKAPKDFSFDLSTDLLITTKKIIEIKI